MQAVATAELGPFAPEAHRDLAGREIHNRGDDEERRHAIRPALEQHAMLALDHLKSANTAPNRHAHPRRVLRPDLKTTRGNRHGGPSHRELNEPAAFLDVLRVEPIHRVEVLDFAGDAGDMA